MDESRRVYGIDLGTTYSCISKIDKHDQPVVIQNVEGDLTTPSVVYYESEKATVVGKEAKNQLAAEPENTVCFIKREMSKDECFLKPTKHPFGEDPSEISSRILRKVVKDANDNRDPGEEPITDVVITCPAYFGNNERERTRQAGIMAGLNVIDIINEPTAAAISYGIKADSEQTIMVYDLGGGTFDVTIIRVNGGHIRVVATDGKHDLGGADWDESLAEYMLSQFNTEHGTNLSLRSDERLYYTFMLEAEQAKKALTPEGKSQVRRNISWEGMTSRIEVSRDTFNALTEDKLQLTIDITNQAINAARQKEGASFKIDEVLLVGGSSRMPQVKSRVDSEFNCDAKLNDPDQCVAKGAALYALNRKYSEMVANYEDGNAPMPKTLPTSTRTHVVNVTSKTYGTDVNDDEVMNMIFKDDALPAHAEGSFSLMSDNQSNVGVMVFESTVSDQDNDRVIKRDQAKCLSDQMMQIKGNYPKGTTIKMSFDLAEDGTLAVHAEIQDENIDYQLQITGVRSKDELAATTKRLLSSEVN